MRTILLTLLTILMLVNQVLAISPTTAQVINDAQAYGITNAKLELSDFLLPWTAYEEQAIQLNQTTERACLYTPFLLVATDAREKYLNSKVVDVSAGKNIVDEYAGMMSFSVMLFGDKPNFAANVIATIKQNNKDIKAYQAITPGTSEKIKNPSGETLYASQCYFYFLNEDVNLKNPAILSIKTNDQVVHNFYFNLVKIK